jgi:hypothetical protein
MPVPTVRRCPRGLALATIAPLLGTLVVLAPAAQAGTLTANGLHTFEVHSPEDHSYESLTEIDLTGANLTGSDLTASILNDSVFVEAILVGTNLSEADLKDAALTDAVFDGTDLENAVFWGADLRGADLSTAVNADSADFDTAYFDVATVFSGAEDTSGMYEALAACPTDPSQWLVDTDGDGIGDACHEMAPLPEPDAITALACGIALLGRLARSRALSRS